MALSTNFVCYFCLFDLILMDSIEIYISQSSINSFWLDTEWSCRDISYFNLILYKLLQ